MEPAQNDRLKFPVGRCVELSMSGHNLRDMDWFSKSDPFVVLFVRGGQGGYGSNMEGNTTNDLLRKTTVPLGNRDEWRCIGQTEVVWNELSPHWVKKFYLPYQRSIQKAVRLRFEIFDQDDESGNLDKQDFLGIAECDLVQITRVKPRIKSMTLMDRKLKEKKKLGSLIVSAEVIEATSPPHMVDVRFLFTVGCEMPHKESVFYVLSRAVSGAPELWTRIHRSGAMEPPKNWATAEFGFQDVSLTEEQLTAGDNERPLRIELYINRNNGSHMLAGRSQEFTLGALDTKRDGNRYPLVPDPKSGAGLERGEITVNTQFVQRSRSKPREQKSQTERFYAGANGNRNGDAHMARRLTPLVGLANSVIIFRAAKLNWSLSKGGGRGILDRLKTTRL